MKIKIRLEGTVAISHISHTSFVTHAYTHCADGMAKAQRGLSDLHKAIQNFSSREDRKTQAAVRTCYFTSAGPEQCAFQDTVTRRTTCDLPTTPLKAPMGHRPMASQYLPMLKMRR